MKSALEEAIYATTTATSTEKRSQIRIQHNTAQRNTTQRTTRQTQEGGKEKI